MTEEPADPHREALMAAAVAARAHYPEIVARILAVSDEPPERAVRRLRATDAYLFRRGPDADAGQGLSPGARPSVDPGPSLSGVNAALRRAAWG